ncbi:MAG: hemolysin family protein [Longimicrobiales bacterium]|nr:hemolysin family protein [Longimicrobiales bacterium]
MITLSVVLLELAILLVLVVANGLLAGAEIAVVSSRKVRLNDWARKGNKAAANALELANSPNRFLSTVQLGMTTVAVAAGAFGGVRLAGTLSPVLVAAGLPGGIAERLAIGIAVVTATYVTLVIGELVPKRIARHDPERMAARAAGPMLRLSVLATPLVNILGHSTDLVLRLVPLKEQDQAKITEEEIRGMIAHATETGVLEATEQQIVERLFRLSDRTVNSLMTPRDRIVWLDRSAGPESWSAGLGDVLYARYPVADGELDRYVGYVKVQDLLALSLSPEPQGLDSILRKPHLLPGWTPVFRLLELFQWSNVHMAFVTDDDGRVQGIVTLYDVMEGILGHLPETLEAVRPGLVERADGSWLVDGLLPFQEFLNAFQRQEEDRREFPTLHTFMVASLHEEPRPASVVHWKGLRLEIMDMDGSRVDKVLVREAAPGTG